MMPLRHISDAAARAEILAAFEQASDAVYYDDLAVKLRIPIEQASRICEALIDEGVVGEITLRTCWPRRFMA